LDGFTFGDKEVGVDDEVAGAGVAAATGAAFTADGSPQAIFVFIYSRVLAAEKFEQVIGLPSALPFDQSTTRSRQFSQPK
jgi:hypothetical protein